MGDNFNIALNSLWESLENLDCKDCDFQECCQNRKYSCDEVFCDVIWKMKFLNDHKEE